MGSTWLSKRMRTTAPLKVGGDPEAVYVPVTVDRAPPVTVVL